ncbi:MAG: ABC1 kinase family protein [Polyangiales bacterium]
MAENETKLPQGRLARLSSLAKAGARTGTSLLLRQSGEAAAAKAAATLGQLRGVAAKAGQMAAYVDGLVPETQREAYEQWMQHLWQAAPSSSAQAVQTCIETELGVPLNRLFRHFEPEPFASASIGQVHRAQLHDGRAVAVKVQHPGIHKAMQSDLKNLGMLESLTGTLGSRRLDSKQMLHDVRERLREELDYSLEAERQQAFAALHRADSHIHIPTVIRSHSSRKVLTTTLAHGRPFQAALAASTEARQQWCATLWRFVFKGILFGGIFNADPHPGNYLFDDDGRIHFLDFGCVQTQSPERRHWAVAVHRAALAGDKQAFDKAAATLLGHPGGAYERWALDYVQHCFAPIFHSPFHITRNYAASMVEAIQELSRQSLKGKFKQSIDMPPGMFFMNRLQCGFYSVLARLDVEVDYAAVERRLLAELPDNE